MGEGEGHLSKELQVRSKGERGEMHREQEGEHPKQQHHSFVSLYTFYLILTSVQRVLRLILCPGLCSKKAEKILT